jgi:hypothetical protein
MLSDLATKDALCAKDDLTIGMITIRIVLDKADSMTIKRNLRVIDNPANLLQVLHHQRAIEEGIKGNNIKSGPDQHTFVRQFLSGESLRVFDEAVIENGTETVNNLVLSLNGLVKFNCPQEVLSKQTDYLKNHLYKPMNLTTRQYVGRYNNLNSICEQLLPNFSAGQKISKRECIIIIAGKTPKIHQSILIQQGFNPENGSMADLINYCEHA